MNIRMDGISFCTQHCFRDDDDDSDDTHVYLKTYLILQSKIKKKKQR